MYFDLIHLTPPAIAPLSPTTKLCVLISNTVSLCCSCAIGYVAFHGSTVDLVGTAPLKKTDSPDPSSSQSPIKTKQNTNKNPSCLPSLEMMRFRLSCIRLSLVHAASVAMSSQMQLRCWIVGGS